MERLKTFRALRESENLTVVTTIDALMTPVISLDVLNDNIMTLKVHSVCETEALSIKLTNMGYERVDIVDAPGQYAVRGGIVDIFDLTMDNPVGIEFWGDEVDSIRYFDVQSQRSIEKVKSALSCK